MLNHSRLPSALPSTSGLFDSTILSATPHCVHSKTAGQRATTDGVSYETHLCQQVTYIYTANSEEILLP